MKKILILSLMLGFYINMNMFAVQNDESSLENKLYAIDKATSFAMTGALALSSNNVIAEKKAVCFMLSMCGINVIANTVSFAKQKKRHTILKMTPALATLVGSLGVGFYGEKKNDSISNSLALTAGFGLLSNMAKNICDLWFLFQ